MKTIPHTEESLCRSYLTAVAAVARQNLWLQAEHDYGVDGMFKMVEARGSAPQRLHETGFAIDFQAKSSINWEFSQNQNDIEYSLDANAYNDLAERSAQTRSTPFFLILFCLPKDMKTWLKIEEERLTMERCAYFTQIKAPLTTNTNTKKISIPRVSHLTPTAINQILTGVKTGVITP